jgi:DNA polymerase
MRTLYIDLETYSDNDITLGVHKYVDSDNFEIMLLAYAFDDEKPVCIDLKAGETLPEELKHALLDADTLKTAFNANFELTCMEKVFPELTLPAQWECDMALARYHSYGGGLGLVAKALGLPEDKQKDARGRRLIQYFCKPVRPTKKNGGRTRNLPEHAPEDWAVFKEYNLQDVVTERAIRKALIWLRPNEAEHRLWLLDHDINCRGVHLDMGLVEAAIRINEAYTEKLMEQARDITGLENPNSVAQLKEWLRLNGHPVTTINKETVESMLQDKTLHPTLREMLGIRMKLGKTSIKKYMAMRDSICHDKAAHDLFQFYGASRTGRWAGRNIQLQNLPRNYLEDLDAARETVKAGDMDWLEIMYDNVPDTLSQLIRTAIIPKEGYKFVVADFSAIEARVIAWLADESWVLDAFRQGKDIYCATASKMFKVPVEKHGANSELRQKGKVAVLACGYGGGVEALKAMGGDKLGLSDPELQQIVDDWRKASPHIVKLWRKLDFSAKQVLRRGGFMDIDHGVRFLKEKGHLLLKLPSGRFLVYLNARIGTNRFDGESIVYDGIAQTTGNLEEMETYSGKLAENLTQAVARDCLAEAMMALEAAGYPIVAHIHDEVVLEVPDTEEYSLDKAVEIMTRGASWNEGLPLSAAGFESHYYMKD